jgi:hypothetical protein
MQTRPPLLFGLALVLALALVLSSCGSENSSISDAEGAKAVILDVSELPKGSTKAQEALVSEACDPATYFEDYATATADPFGFILPNVELLQTVGVFETPEQAKRAFDEVSSKAARSCVQTQMQKGIAKATGEQGKVTSEDDPQPVSDGTAKTMRLLVSADLATVELKRTAILEERLLTTVTLISLNQPLSKDLWEEITGNAANRASDTVASLES